MGFRDFFGKSSGGGKQAMTPVMVAPRLRHLELGREDIEATGESYRREAIAEVFTAAGRPLGGVIMRIAVLVADPDNKYDSNAVMVFVDGQHVAWVPAELAPGVQAVVNAHVAETGQHLPVPARLWACFENGQWSGRVTLALSGATEPEWSYVDQAAWPGNRSPDGSERLTQTGFIQRIRDTENAALVRGQSFEVLRPHIAEAKTSGDVTRALELLNECIDAAERQALVSCLRPTVWPTEQAAILFRKQKDYRSEIDVLERFLAADPSHEGTKGLRERLAKARSLIGDTTPVPEPVSASNPRLSVPPYLDISEADLVSVTLPAAVELSYEAEHQDTITAVFAEAGASMGTALEIPAVLREIFPPDKRYSVVAVYAGGRLVGYVNSPLYRDQVLEVLHSPAVAGKTAVVRCRIYATDIPKWTARATLGPYEAVVESLDDTESAAQGRANQAVMAEVRRERLAAGGREAVDQMRRLVRGRDFVEWVQPVTQLRRDGEDETALQLLMECIGAAECDSLANGWAPPPWYTEQASIILRKRRDNAGEIEVLERYVAACPEGIAKAKMAERLVKARMRAGKAAR